MPRPVDVHRRALFDHGPLAVIEWDTGFRVLEWNAAAERLFGFPRADALGRHGSFLVPEALRSRVDAGWAALKSARGGTSSDGEHVTSDGKRIVCRWYNTPVHDADGRLQSVLSMVEDVTDRVSADHARRVAEEKLAAAFHGGIDYLAITRLDDGTFVEVNEAFERMTGYRRDEAIGRRATDLGIWAIPSQRAEVVEKLSGTSALRDFPMLLGTKEGRRIDCLLTTFVATIDDTPCLVSVIRDVSELRHKEREQLESEAKFSTAFEASPEPMAITRTADGSLLDVNDAWLAMSGFDRAEVIGRTTMELQILGNPGDRRAFVAALERDGKVIDMPWKFRRKDGTVIDALHTGYQVSIDGQTCHVSVVRDVTALLARERAVRESESKYATVFQSAVDPMAIIRTADGLIYDCNDAWLRLFDYPREQMIGNTVLALRLVADLAQREALVAAIRSGGVRDMPYTVRRRDGELRECLQTSFPVEINGEQCHVALSHDITEEKRRERELRESEARFSAAFRGSVDAMGIVRTRDGLIIDVNDAYVQLTGYSREELLGHAVAELGINADASLREPFVEQLLRDGRVRDLSWSTRTKSGEIRETLHSAFRIDIEGEPHHVAIIRDVTAMRRAESALRESEAKFSTVFRTNLDPMGIIRSEDGLILEVNDAWETQFGYRREELVGHTVPEKNLAANPGQRAELLRALRAGGVRDLYYPIRRKGGEIREALQTAYPLHIDGVMHHVAVFRDVTEERRAERELKESEAKFAAAFQSGVDAMVITRLSDGLILDANEAYCSLTGYRREALIGKTTLELNIVADPEGRAQRAAHVRLHGSVRDVPSPTRNRHGEVRDCMQTSYAIEIGGEACMVSVLRDVTEQRRAERELRESEGKFSAAFRGSVDPMVISRQDNGVVLDMNEAHARLTGYSREELVGRSGIDLGLVVDLGARDQLIAAVRRDGSVRDFPFPMRNRGGERRDCLQTSFGIDIGGAPCLVSVLRDVTEVRRAERALRRLAEGTSVGTEDGVFVTLLRDLTEALETEVAWIGVRSDRLDSLRTVARLEHGVVVESGDIALPGSATEAVARGESCLCVDGAGARYAADEFVARLGLRSIAGAPLKDSAGQVVGVLMVASSRPVTNPDIVRSLIQVFSERASHELTRLEAESALRESEQKFAALFHSSPVALVVADAETGRMIDVNDAWERVLGCTRSQAIGKSGTELRLWADPRQREEIAREFASKGESTRGEVAMRRGGDTPILCAVSARMIILRGRRLSIFAFQDVTEQKQAVDALRASEARLAEAQRVAHLGNWERDYVTGEALWSDEVYRLLGYAPQAFEPGEERLFQAVHPEDRAAVRAALDRAKKPESSGIYHVEHRVASADGSERILEHRARVTFDKSGRPVRIVGTTMDITEQRLAQRQVEELNAQLEQRVQERTAELAETLETLRRAQRELVQSEKLAALGSLVAGVAHELNTPIGNSVTVASTLADLSADLGARLADGLTRSALASYVHNVQEGANILMRNLGRAGDLITSFKQVAVDQTSSQRREFALDEIVNEILMTLSPVLKRSPVRVDVDVPPGLRMDSYPGPLDQVLTNLVNNALVHGLEGQESGALRICARRSADTDTDIVLEVSDDGKGIAEENLQRVFEPFFTTRLGRGGSGLGLHIVHSIVTGILGGRIAVESRPGHGTRFTLTLPLSAPRAEPRITEDQASRS